MKIPATNRFSLLLISVLFLLSGGCGKDEDQHLPPEVHTGAVSDITQISAQCSGKIIADHGALITEKGVCWSTSPNPTTADFSTKQGEGANPFTSQLEGLTIETKYYVRAYAVTTHGTGYGNEVSFTTEAAIKLTDIDGNIYKARYYGDDVWMIENLKTTRFNDGTPIDLEPTFGTWFYLTKPAFCWYDNNETANKDTYGALYNWRAVHAGNLCPAGWHVPDEGEWMAMEVHLGMGALEADNYGWRGDADQIGGKMKQEGVTLWNPPNLGATNASGFTALPGGGRNLYGTFEYKRDYGYWWTATETDSTYAWARSLSTNLHTIYKSQYYKQSGFSVRCVRD
jgi:uncharacterized protein (TIGR02145 family)